MFSSVSVPASLFSVAVPSPTLFSPSVSSVLSTQTFVVPAARAVMGASVKNITAASSKDKNVFLFIFLPPQFVKSYLFKHIIPWTYYSKSRFLIQVFSDANAFF